MGDEISIEDQAPEGSPVVAYASVLFPWDGLVVNDALTLWREPAGVTAEQAAAAQAVSDSSGVPILIDHIETEEG